MKLGASQRPKAQHRMLSSSLYQLVTSLLLVPFFIQIVQWGGNCIFLYLWLFYLAFAISIMMRYPQLPMYPHKYVSLPEGKLKKDIEKLAARTQFPVDRIYLVESSGRSFHVHAFTFGFFKYKGIALSDALLGFEERLSVKYQIDISKNVGYTRDEILAVLGHEIGHWKHNHIIKNFIIKQFYMLIMFVIYSNLYKLEGLYTAFGFSKEQPALIGFLITHQYLIAPFNTILDFFKKTQSCGISVDILTWSFKHFLTGCQTL